MTNIGDWVCFVASQQLFFVSHSQKEKEQKNRLVTLSWCAMLGSTWLFESHDCQKSHDSRKNYLYSPGQGTCSWLGHVNYSVYSINGICGLLWLLSTEGVINMVSRRLQTQHCQKYPLLSHNTFLQNESLTVLPYCSYLCIAIYSRDIGPFVVPLSPFSPSLLSLPFLPSPT